MKEVMQENPKAADNTAAGISRRRFLTFAGGIAGAGILIESCKKDKSTTTTTPEGALDLGMNDQGLLNYLYALAQFGAAYYVKVNESPFIGMVEIETKMLADIRDHNMVYRELFKTHLGANRIQALEFNFEGINFTDRDTVLGFGKYITNVMVYAYNAVARLIVSPEYVLLAAKIGSVQARHSAVLRDLTSWGSFSDTTDARGIDTYMDPPQVVSALEPYFKTKISGDKLPTK